LLRARAHDRRAVRIRRVRRTSTRTTFTLPAAHPSRRSVRLPAAPVPSSASSGSAAAAAANAGRFRFAPILTATVLTVLLLWMFGKAADVFILLFLAVLISLYLGAVADVFSRRLRLPPRLALLMAILVSLGGLVGLVWLLVPPVVEQTQQLVTVLPRYIGEWEAGIGRFVTRFPALQQFWRPEDHKMIGAVYEQVTHSFGSVVPKVFGLVHAAISVFSVAVMGLYLALYPGTYREELIELFPPVHRDLVRDVLNDLSIRLRSYIVGQLIAMSVLAALTALGLYLLDVPYWLTFGIFTGAVAIVPFFGTLVSTVIPALFVLGGDGFGSFGVGGHATLVILLGVVIHLIESNIVMPLITADRTHLPPVLTIMAVLIVGKLMGGVGLVVAVPILVTITVVVRRILINRIYEGHGFRRAPRDRTLTLRVPAPDGGVLVPDGAPLDLITLAEREQRR
jgi:predicted PurR-regulated permease PerM